MRINIYQTSGSTAIKIGDVHYNINLTAIPYLSYFIDFQIKAHPETTEFVHRSIPLFDVALKGIESGYRYCFRLLPPELLQQHILCDTYLFLGIDLLEGQSTDQVISDLKSGRTDFELEYKRYREIKGDKSKARDAAFKLLFLILRGEFTNDVRDSAKIFNAVLYVVSHSATFKWRTRRVVRDAYEERFVVSVKQKDNLNKWEKTNPDKLAAEDAGDVTTF